jgi:hypothetical protein
MLAFEVDRRTRDDPQSEQFNVDEMRAGDPIGRRLERPSDAGAAAAAAPPAEAVSSTIVKVPLQSAHVPFRIRASRPTNSTAAPQWGQELDMACYRRKRHPFIAVGGQ